MHAALPHLTASRRHVVAVSSLAGLVGVPCRTAYCATKFAMTGFFEALGVEPAAGVGVTVVYPSVVATEIRRRGFDAGPKGKLGRWLKRLAPRLVRLAAAALARQPVR